MAGLLDFLNSPARRNTLAKALRQYGTVSERQARVDNAKTGSVGAPGGLLGAEGIPRNRLADGLLAGASFVPGAGDIVGLVNDARMYQTQPEERKLSNYLLTAAGALPFIPAMAGKSKDVVSALTSKRAKFDFGKLLKEQAEEIQRLTWPRAARADLDEAYKAGEAMRKYGDNLNDVDLLERLPPELSKHFNDDTATVFVEAGFRGDPPPPLVRGWRHGDIPKSGTSTNYRDNFREKGVSVMEAYGHGKTEDEISALFIGNGAPRVEVQGYLNPYSYGSDGEPLLVDTKRVDLNVAGEKFYKLLVKRLGGEDAAKAYLEKAGIFLD